MSASIHPPTTHRPAQGHVTQRHPWPEWKATIVRILRQEYREILPEVSEDDVHWDAWRRYYDEGNGPRRAVNRAFERY